MKKVVAAALILGLVLFLIPMGFRQEKAQEDPETPAVLPESGKAVTILIDGELQEMDLNEYLWGVVAAEMPASFELEALKAQAVAARTYSLNKAGQAVNHPEADLCTDHTCCQAWIARENAQWNGFGSPEFTALTGNVTQDHALMASLRENRYDVVLVNIVADVIIGLAPTLPRFMDCDTTLICSGILDTRLNDVLAALEQAGLSVTQTRAKEDWRCVVAKRRSL